MTTKRLQPAKMNVLQLIEQIVERSMGKKLEINKEVKPFVTALSNRLKIEAMEALFLSVIVDQCDEGLIRISTFAKHFGVRNISIMAYSEYLDSLAEKGVIRIGNSSNCDKVFFLRANVFNLLKEGRLPSKEDRKIVSDIEWIDIVDDFFDDLEMGNIEESNRNKFLEELIDENQHLSIPQKLKAFGFGTTTNAFLLAFCLKYINDHDEEIREHDINDYFSKGEFRCHLRQLENGTHVLIENNFLEYACVDGQVDPTAWRITERTKNDFLTALNLKSPIKHTAYITKYSTLTEKKMYYNPPIEKQIEKLRSLLQKDKMNEVLQRMEQRGLRKGFTCIFYGAPGTGKTETVQQLARQTQRDIMLVDIPSIRSKWVGDTEKNIKQIFERYKEAVKTQPVAPILLFNEADAILNKRSEGATESVDKMENAMQNIILQEMETFEGILIATTNLTGSLDKAFERRFLYKVEFKKPEPEHSRHIWQSLIPDLTEEDTIYLARNYDFSGGQIENVARKALIDDILSDHPSLNRSSIEELCSQELLSKSRKQVGF